MAKNDSEEIDFQLFVDGMKQKKISWDFFVEFVQSFSYSTIDRLNNLNAILLGELTMNYSDLDKSKYLNEILLIQFKNYIEKEHAKQLDNTEDSNVNHILFEGRTQEVAENEAYVQQQIVNEITENDSFEEKTTEILTNDDIHMPIMNEMTESDYYEETATKVLTNEDIQMPSINEIREDLISSCKEEIIKHNSSNENNPKIFVCNICNKKYNIFFHLKQHIKKVHENDLKIDENKIATTLIPNENNLKRYIPTNHEGQKDHKCESCSKSFCTPQYLKKHIHTIHEGLGRKDHKCESCEKSFPSANILKTHNRTVHESQKDHNCESCGFSFSHAEALKRHNHRIHEDRKDYKCEFCWKLFSHEHYLKKHIEQFHGYNYYKCESCVKSFSEAGQLRAHIYTVHEGHQ